MYINCENCGQQTIIKPYELIKFKHHFCSKKCSSIHRNKKIILHCNHCNKEFYRRKSHIHKYNFCSKECDIKFKTGKTFTHQKTDFKIIKCKQCGKEKKVYKFHVDRGQYKFCSDNCRKVYGRKGIDIKELTKKCLICGKEFHIKPSTLIRGAGKYCSKICYAGTLIKKCKNCGNEYKISRSQYPKSFYCSNACYKAYRGESSIEKIVREFLEKLKIEFKTQQQFKRYVVDFLIPQLGIIIEADGEYWHNKDSKIIERDKNKNKYLINLGYKVIRLKERDIKNGSFKNQLCLN